MRLIDRRDIGGVGLANGETVRPRQITVLVGVVLRIITVKREGRCRESGTADGRGGGASGRRRKRLGMVASLCGLGPIARGSDGPVVKVDQDRRETVRRHQRMAAPRTALTRASTRTVGGSQSTTTAVIATLLDPTEGAGLELERAAALLVVRGEVSLAHGVLTEQEEAFCF